MTNKELEEAFMENIKYGQRYIKRMYDANPDKKEGTFKYTLRDVFKRFAFGIVWSDFDNLGDAE